MLDNLDIFEQIIFFVCCTIFLIFFILLSLFGLYYLNDKIETRQRYHLTRKEKRLLKLLGGRYVTRAGDVHQNYIQIWKVKPTKVTENTDISYFIYSAHGTTYQGSHTLVTEDLFPSVKLYECWGFEGFVRYFSTL